MDIFDYKEKIERMRVFFNSNRTKSVEGRINALKRLYEVIVRYENVLLEALQVDLSKSYFEGYTTEIMIVLDEIKFQIKHLKQWSKTRYKRMPILFFPSKSYIMPEPFGVVLVMGTWNYPFHLLFNPLVAAIAAGNCVMLKTSPASASTAQIMETIVKESFTEDYVNIMHGNREINQLLLAEKFDYIFFTGNPTLGKVVMEAAAKYLTPVTLELGGKSPCIVDEDANLKLAARRIVWGKTINCGQTCIAPDYLMVHEKVKDDFLLEVKNSITEMYGKNIFQSPDYPRIISQKAMTRLVGYLKEGKIVLGGKYNETTKFIEPTIIEDLPENAQLLHEEVFGPIFPLLTFNRIEEVIDYVKQREKPLALYYFTNNKKKSKKVLWETSSGGACVNDTLIHIGNSRVPFGGIGNSGMGQYHGKYGFDTFSHYKSFVLSATWCDIKIKYPPYKDKFKRFKGKFF